MEASAAHCPISSTDGFASNSESVATSRKASKPYIISTGRIFSLYERLIPSCAECVQPVSAPHERTQVASPLGTDTTLTKQEEARPGLTTTRLLTRAIAGGSVAGLLPTSTDAFSCAALGVPPALARCGGLDSEPEEDDEAELLASSTTIDVRGGIPPSIARPRRLEQQARGGWGLLSLSVSVSVALALCVSVSVSVSVALALSLSLCSTSQAGADRPACLLYRRESNARK